MVIVCQVPFGQLQTCCRDAAAEMVALLEGSPFSTEERYQVVGHLNEYGQFRWPASSRTNPDGSAMLLGNFKASKHFLYPLVFALTCTLNCRTLQIGVCLSQLCPFKLIYHRWTPVKVQKGLMANQWK